MMNLYEALKAGSTVEDIRKAFANELEAAQVKLQEDAANVQKEEEWKAAVEGLAAWYRKYEGYNCVTLRPDAKRYFDAAIRSAYGSRVVFNPIDEFMKANGL